MKWRTPTPRLHDKKVGDIRTRSLFAIIPREAADGFTYWLQKVVVKERLTETVALDHHGVYSEEVWTEEGCLGAARRANRQ